MHLQLYRNVYAVVYIQKYGSIMGPPEGCCTDALIRLIDRSVMGPPEGCCTDVLIQLIHWSP